jgi:hypothetical protein
MQTSQDLVVHERSDIHNSEQVIVRMLEEG